MKTILQDLFSAFVMGLVVPAFLLGGAVTVKNQAVMTEAPTEEKIPETQASSFFIGRRLNSGDVVTEDLEAYLVGVILAEMPGEFEPEALKAQAVAARTYTLKADQSGGKHADGSICTESSCCQAYISAGDYLNLGGTTEVLEKITAAVLDTRGQVLTYEGELIEATYFSCSGGRTEDAVAVWGAEFPYLVSVPSPGEESADHYTETRVFTPEEFQAALGITLDAEPGTWLGMTSYTNGGGVDFMVIGDRQFSGAELRSLLGLRSTAFSAEMENGEIRITTKGYGHRVGMSQYGAEAMAVGGSTYDEILAHYYPGTSLEKWQ